MMKQLIIYLNIIILEKDYKYNIKIIEAVIKESNIKALSDFLEDPKIDISNNINENNKER